MITSYGSDESDSDTVDENRSKNDPSSIIESKNKNSALKLRCSEKCSLPTSVMQSQLRTISQNTNQKYENKDDVEESIIESLNSKSTENTEMKYLKNQIKQQNNIQETNECSDKADSSTQLTKESTIKKSISKHNVDSDIDFRISLVPGYDEDSDIEEDSEIKQERKALFPIPQIEETVESVSSRKTIVEDDRTADSNDSDINNERKNVLEQDTEDILERLECKDDSSVKSEGDTQKGNKFVDNMHGRNKFFQRKKRIAFDGKCCLQLNGFM